MKKISSWLVAILAALVSLLAMCLFDLLLSWIGFYIAKVPFLTDIIEGIGEILDLGLTALIAIVIASSIWQLGLKISNKITGQNVEFEDSALFKINNMFLFVFLAAFVFLGFNFFTIIGDTVTAYTADIQGFTKFLMFLKAIKDTFIFVCNDSLLIYTVGGNSFVLFVINIFYSRFI